MSLKDTFAKIAQEEAVEKTFSDLTYAGGGLKATFERAQAAGQFPKNAFADTLPQGTAGPVRNDRIMPAYRQSQSREENYGPAGGNIDTSKDYLPLDSEWSTRDQYTVGVNDRKYTILDEGGKSIIIPMVDASRMSPQLTDREAVELYHKTGKNYGTFDSYDAARAYLDVLKAKDRARQYDAGTLTDRDAVYVEKDKRELERKEREMRKSYGDADSNFIKALQLAAQSGLGTTNAGLSNISELYRNNKNMQQSDKAISTVSAEERQQIGEKSAALGVGYDLVQNFAMNAPAMAAGGATGLPIVGSAVIFASSFGNDLKYAEEGGHDPGRAYAYAFLDGLNQAALDYVGSIPGISKIGDTLTKNIKNPVLKFLGNMGEEALTEDAQSVLENGLKNIILGEEADASPFSEEAMYSALLGALSAGILNGPQTVLEAGRTVSVGNSFIKNDKIGDAIKLGLSNVKSSEEYQTAAKMATEMTEGKTPSAYQLGALVIQSLSDTATTARTIDTAVRESARDTGVSDDVAETVAAVAVRFSKKVCFVPSDAAILQTDGSNGSGAAVGAYDSASDTIFLNAGVSSESATEFVLKHELTHGIEKTSMWKSLRRVARQQMGDAAFDAEVSRIQSRRAAVGEALDTEGAEKEVVANFVGNNLFTENFAEAITRQDTKLSSVFAGTFYRLRYAMDAIRNGRQAARMQYAERLFTAALDKTPGTVHLGTDGDVDTEGETQFSAAGNDNQRYSYEELVKKPDMPVVDIGGAEEVEGLTRKQIIDKAKENAQKVGKVDNELLYTSVHVDDTNTDVIITKDGLRHGLDRRLQANAGVTIHAGEILKNSVCINEIVSKKAGATGAYILIGAAENSTGNLYIVEFVVNRYSGELVTMDVLYSLNAKKEGTAVLNAPGVSRSRYRSTISISEILEYVNRKFPDVLSMDVLKHFGHTERPSGELGSSAVYSFSERTGKHAFADDADGGIAVEEKTKTDGKVQPDADAYTKYRDDTLAPGRVIKALQDTSDADAIGEVKQKAEAEETKRRTKFQKKQEAELGDLLRRFKNGAISEEEYKSEQARLIDEAVAENDKKWRAGNRGPAAIREMLGSDNRYARETYVQKEVEIEKQERREKAAAAEEKKAHTSAKNQAMKDMHELEERLKNPQKRRYIDAEDTQHVLDLLRAITIAEGDERQYIAEKEEKRNNAVYPATQSRYDNEIRKAINSGEATSAKLDHLRLLYKNLLNSDLLKTAYSSEIDARLGAFIEKVKGKAFSDFTTEEFKELSAIVHSYLYTTEKALKFPAEVFGEEKEVSEAMPTLLNELEQNASKMPRALRNLVNLHMDVKRVFAGLFGGYHKDSWWRKVGEYLDGRGKMEVSVENDFRECFASVAGKEDIQRLSLHGKKDLVDVGLVDKNGKPVLVTRGMMVLLHMHINNAANIHALVENKFLVPDFNGYYRDGGKQSYIDGTLATVADSNIKEIEQLYLELQDAGKAEKEDLQYRYDELISKEKGKWYAVGKTIESLMTEDEKKFEKRARVWWNEKQKEYINKTSMVLDGYPKALSDDYVPIHRQSTMLHHDVETVRVDRRLENAGMLKSRRAHSQVPILATDITTELREAVDFTKKYYAYAEPIKVLSKILDYTNLERTDSTRERLGKTFGKSRSPLGVSGEELLANLIADLNGARKSSGSAVDKFFGVVRNNTVRAVMSLNPRVAVSQFSAVPQIVSCISGNSFSKGVPRAVALLFKGKEARVAQNKLMSKYSAAWASRSANNSAGMEEIVAAKEGNTFIDRAYRWADDKTHGAINLTGKADAIATGAIIWFGCEEEIKTTHPELKVGSEEYYKAVGELQDQVIYETQPDEHIMNRSEIQRQPGVLSKLVTLFGSPGFKTYNQFMNAYQEMVVYSKDQKEGKHGVTEADVKAKKEKFARVTAYSVIASQVLYATLRMAYNAMIHNLNGYRDDDGELNAGSIANAMGLEAISQIADLVPFGGQVYEVVAARVLGEKYYGLDDNALEAVGNILNDIANGNFKNPATYNKLIGDLSSALGIPYKNISSTVKGILYHAEDIKNGEFLSFKAGSGVGMTQTYRQLYKAMASGKTEKAQSLREYLLSSGKSAAEIESGIRAAIRSENTDAKKQAERAIEEAMTNMYFDSFTEKEQNRVESSLRSFYADKVFSKAGGDMTAANEKAEKAVKKGVSAADYFVAQVLKNARFADKNGDGKVNKAEYRTLVDDMECTERVKQILKNMK